MGLFAASPKRRGWTCLAAIVFNIFVWFVIDTSAGLDPRLKLTDIPVLEHRPPIDEFVRAFGGGDGPARPLIVRGFANDWPAKDMWSRDYLSLHCGNRTLKRQPCAAGSAAHDASGLLNLAGSGPHSVRQVYRAGPDGTDSDPTLPLPDVLRGLAGYLEDQEGEPQVQQAARWLGNLVASVEAEDAQRDRHPGRKTQASLRSQLSAQYNSTLVPADLALHHVATLGELIAAQATEHTVGARADASLYLHDASVDSLCPVLLEDLRVPSLFPCDLALLFDDVADGECSRQYPSLFVGRRGSGSPLHIDAFGMQFWMVVLEGSKRWVMFAPNQTHLLSPKAGSQGFEADVLRPDAVDAFPDLAAAEGMAGVVYPGDLLYSPNGWAHQVVNLEDSIAVAGNFVDAQNWKAAVREASRRDASEQQSRLRAAANALRAAGKTDESVSERLCPDVPDSRDGGDERWDAYWVRHKGQRALKLGKGEETYRPSDAEL